MSTSRQAHGSARQTSLYDLIEAMPMAVELAAAGLVVATGVSMLRSRQVVWHTRPTLHSRVPWRRYTRTPVSGGGATMKIASAFL